MGQHREVVDLIEIEMIDSDPELFPEAASPTRIARPRWLVPAAIAVAVSIAAVLVVALQPWSSEPSWRTYPVALRFPPSISSHQVLGAPTGDAAALQDPEAPLATAVTRSTLVGHVFAEPGARYSDGRWVTFSALPSFAPPAPAGVTDVQVHGIDATVAQRWLSQSIAWGPYDRYDWRVEGSLAGDVDLMEFAEAVGVRTLQPALRDSFDLRGLEPLGGIEALRTVEAVGRALDGQRVEHSPAPTIVSYLGDVQPTILLSIPAPPDVLPLVPFVFGGGIDIAVHGQPGVAISRAEGDTLVAWFEGGRLFVVTSDLGRADAVSLAESTRPATDEEWVALHQIGQHSFGFGRDAATLDGQPGTDIGSGVTPSGSEWRMWAFAESNAIAFCVGVELDQQCQATVGDEQPPLDDWYLYGGHVSVRFGEVGEVLLAFVTTEQGGAMGHPFVPLRDGRSAIAVFVPEGAELTVSELQPSSEAPSD